MTMPHANLRWVSIFRPFAIPTFSLVALLGCARGGSFIPDTSERIAPVGARAGTSADDVFMRKPWEIWRGPHGIGRHHRETSMVFSDMVESFKAGDISVYAADGSDVRLDYVAIDLGEGSQSREEIVAFVYRAKTNLEQEWNAVTARAMRDRPGAAEAAPFPLPTIYPSTTKVMAVTVPARAGDSSKVFFQVMLFHQAGWAVRLEITCPAEDVTAARRNTLAFLRAIRVGN